MELSSYKEENAAKLLLRMPSQLGTYVPFPAGIMTDMLEKRLD